MKRLTLFIFLFLLQKYFAFGQVCGGSFNQINFFIPNDSKIPVIEYEVLPLDDHHLDKIFHKTSLDSAVKARMRNNLVNGIYFSELHFDSTTIDDIKPFKSFDEAVENAAVALNEQNKRNGLDTVQVKGAVKGGKLIFPTLELYHKLFILKITSNGHLGIYIMNLFGGCGNYLDLVYDSNSGFEHYANALWFYKK